MRIPPDLPAASPAGAVGTPAEPVRPGTPSSIVPPYIDPLPTPPRSVIVVGAGLAGMRTCLELRAAGFQGALDLVGGERMAPYDRPPLTKQLFTQRSPIWLEEEFSSLADAGVISHLGVFAEHLYADRESVAVTIRTPGRPSSVLTGDAVVLATGARPWVPDGWEGVVTLRTWFDAELLRAELVPETKLIIVGGGWIGCELASVAAAAGCQVTVIEAGHGPLPTLRSPAISQRVAEWFEQGGVHLITDTSVASVQANPGELPTRPFAVTTDSGDVIHADLVVAALGARPDNQWLIGNDAGIPVFGDGHPSGAMALRAGLDQSVLGAPPTVRAVGDCASRWSPRFGFVPSGHWDEALRGPERVAAGLLGIDLLADDCDIDPDPVPYVFSEMFGHDLALFGLIPETADVQTYELAPEPGDVPASFYAEWTRWHVEADVEEDTVERPLADGPLGADDRFADSLTSFSDDAPTAEFEAIRDEAVETSTAGSLDDVIEETIRRTPPRIGSDATPTEPIVAPATRVLQVVAVLTVDRPRLAARARGLFRGPHLPSHGLDA